MSITPSKLEEIAQTCQEFSKLSHFSKCQLQGGIGFSLMFSQQVVKPARYCISRLLDTLHNSPNSPKAPMTQPVRKDINWFLLFVKHFNGTTNCMHESLYCSDVTES